MNQPAGWEKPDLAAIFTVRGQDFPRFRLLNAKKNPNFNTHGIKIRAQICD